MKKLSRKQKNRNNMRSAASFKNDVKRRRLAKSRRILESQRKSRRS